MQLPILKFHNIFKSVIWGGRRIAEFKGLPPQGDTIGESWELSPLPGNESVIEGGDYDGMTINELVEKYPEEVLGKPVFQKYGPHFPLLIKFLDTNADLSIQVHPGDEIALKRHNQSGKTEMWYCLQSDKGAYLYAGFKKHVSKDKFRKMVSDNSVTDILNKVKTHAGDVVPIPAGRIHSLGPGNFLCEIQQASDITYRIYDYDRRDSQGNPRQLHIEESIDAINFNDTDVYIENLKPLVNKDIVLDFNRYFMASLLTVANTGTLDLPQHRSFTVFVCIKGGATLTSPDGSTTPLRQGCTVLLPATMPSVTIKPEGKEAQIITVAIIN